MNEKQFIAKQKMLGKHDPDAEMTPLTEDSPQHPKGFGGAGNSPVKYVKREGSLENKNMKDCSRHMRGM